MCVLSYDFSQVYTNGVGGVHTYAYHVKVMCARVYALSIKAESRAAASKLVVVVVMPTLVAGAAAFFVLVLLHISRQYEATNPTNRLLAACGGQH